ncbi:Hypothetical predicted protein [Cloeon dipterum]|uniref:Uncharacterized protein n=1 Tax=Cloeon dipterum TaxID=197152 RepID=A0A8S1BU32_9INSE|nr:Hypothetical predicted protein [Cloeon dipterum]
MFLLYYYFVLYYFVKRYRISKSSNKANFKISIHPRWLLQPVVLKQVNVEAALKHPQIPVASRGCAAVSTNWYEHAGTRL